MKKFIKENWFKLSIIVPLLVVALSVAYYLVFFLPHNVPDVPTQSSQNNKIPDVASVYTQNNNIFAKYTDGSTKQLTFDGLDGAPYLSSDKTEAIFLRNTEGGTGQSGEETFFNEVFILTLSNLQEKMIFKSGNLMDLNVVGVNSQNYPFDSVNNILRAVLSSDNKTIYFLSVAWTTSDAIFSVNTATGQTRLVSDGNSLDIVKSGTYKDYLIAIKHKYLDNAQTASPGGSYDHYYLMDSNGTEVKMLGDFDSDISKFEDGSGL